MAEEHRFQAQEGHRLCANNCGFFGSPATMNLCSKCYRDFCLKEQQEASIKTTVENSLSASASSSSSPLIGSLPDLPAFTLPEVKRDVTVKAADVSVLPEQQPASPPPPPQPNRCSMCRKRVGLTGFKCRCGTTFCGSHRYPEKHGCTFDFKTVGREEIARANPVVRGQKLEKI